MHSCIGCICLAFLHCAFLNVSSNGLPERMQSHTGCICLSFHDCAFSNISLKNLTPSKRIHTGSIFFLTPVCFHMCPQIAFPRRCIVTLVAFDGLFSSVCFQMSTQISCPRRCIYSYTGCICLIFLHCAFPNAAPNFLP